jgi:putative ABC transport system permease protein
MLFNYIKIAFRNLVRHKTYSIINILGLAIGMACSIILLFFALDQTSYDKRNSKYDRIYMVNTHLKQEATDSIFIGSSLPIGGALKDEYPAVEESVRAHMTGRMYFYDQKRTPIGEDMIYYADPSMFKVFDYEFIYGSPEGALDDPKSIVLNETLAKKYFGDQNPVGKTLSKNNGIDYIVKGVFKDLPHNTLRRYAGLISMSTLRAEGGVYKDPSTGEPEDIDSRKSELFFRTTSQTLTYILLSKNSDINSIKNEFERFKKKYTSEAGDKLNADIEPVFQHLTDAYLYGVMIGPIPWFLFVVYLELSLALFILTIACINYINIATARSLARAREVGVRKVLGADRASLIRQFLCESIIMAVLSLFLALTLVELLLPFFNDLAMSELSFSMLGEPMIFIGLLLIVLFVGLGAGSYPAIFLSSLQPASVVKGNPHKGTGRGRVRKLLVVTQFSISIIIITLTMLDRQAINSIKGMDFGFNRDNIVVITPGDSKSISSLETLKNELKGNPQISAVARSNNTAGYGVNRMFFRVEDKTGAFVEKIMGSLIADPAFINLMGFKLLEGRSFNTDLESAQTDAFLVNETLIKEMGWTGSSIGKRIQVLIGKDKMIDGKVIGVLKDFIFIPWMKVEPMIISSGDSTGLKDNSFLNLLSIKIQSENSAGSIEVIKKKWVELNPSSPFEYKFLKDYINNQFTTPDKIVETLIYFSFFGIFISCLGLFGLSSFVTASRTKEIGVRKVLGASVVSIVFKLSYDFLKLVLVSCIIALPITYYVMNKGAEAFPIKGEVSSWWYVISSVFSLVIAIATVSYHAIKAAMTDPVKALRYE